MRPDDQSVDRELQAAIGRAAEPLADDARARIKARVMAEVRPARAGWSARLAAHRLAVALTTVAVLSGGTAYAANESMPGDPLYAIKRAGENAVVALLPPGRLEQRLLVGLAARRAEEAAALARRGATAETFGGSLDELRDAVRRAAPDEGPLSTEDRMRIREHAEEAPTGTREQIEDAVDSPAGGTDPGPGGTPSGDGTGDGGQSGTGSGSGPGPGSDGDGGTGEGAGGGTGGAGPGGAPEAPKPQNGAAH